MHAHAFVALELIGRSVRIEDGRRQRHRCRQDVATGVDRHISWHGALELRQAEEFTCRAARGHGVAGDDRRGRAGEDEQALRRQRIGVAAVRRLNEEAVALAARYDAGRDHVQPEEGGDGAVALDGVNRGRREVAASSRSGAVARKRRSDREVGVVVVGVETPAAFAERGRRVAWRRGRAGALVTVGGRPITDEIAGSTRRWTRTQKPSTVLRSATLPPWRSSQ